MQTYGLGTALKILLGYNTQYKRNEMVALINSFNKITISVNNYYRMKNPKEDTYIWLKIWGYCGGCLLIFLLIMYKWSLQTKIKKMFKNTIPPHQKLE